MAIGISFLKDITNIEPDFYKAYILSKQYKMHSKKPLIDYMDEPEICLYADLFAERNTLSSIRNYQYGVILTNETMQIRFFIIMKSKNTIYN